MKQNISVVALDLDGTLLNSWQEISKANKAVLTQLMDKGVEVLICTGRSYMAMKKFYAQLELNSPIVCFNGARIVDSRGNYLLHTTLSHEISHRLMAIGEELGVYCHGFVDNRWLIRKVTPHVMEYQGTSGITPEVVDFSSINPLEFTKMMYIDTTKNLEFVYKRLEEEFGNRVYKTFSWSTYLEVLHKDSSKAKALEWYLLQKGLSRDNLLVMGDGGNDIEMLSFAGVGVAMENASDRVKAVANCTAPHHDDDGVALFLRDFFQLDP